MAKIAMDKYGRCIHVPIGNDADLSNINLTDDVSITIKGKVKTIQAERKKGEEYSGDMGRPAELSIEVSEVTFNGKTNTFTTMSHKMDSMDDLEYD